MFCFKEMVNPLKPYVIAEIGANHNGDMRLAKQMIDSAKQCGADCVKFQSWSKESIFSKRVYKDNFFLKDDYRDREDYSLEEMVDEFSIGAQEHRELKEYCDMLSIDFASTPFSKKEVDLLVDELNIPFIKIASMDVDNLPFLKYVASKKVPVVISTVLSKLSDVSRAIECLEENGCSEIVILHCVSIYPPMPDQVNLNNIDMLRACFRHPVGYSDHTLGAIASIISLAKRPCVLEKHFTLDKGMAGWDHKVSADPSELSLIVEAARIGFDMLGLSVKLQVENKERRDAFRRSIVAARNLKKGQTIQEEDLDYKRPGDGLSPACAESVIGKQAKRDIEFDDMILFEDF